MPDFVLAFAVLSVPILAIVGLALLGRRLTKSCGGTRPDGGCDRCGAPIDDRVAAADSSRATTQKPCPARGFPRE